MTPAADLLSRSRAAVWHPCTQMQAHERLPLVPIVRGEGVWLYGPAGERYLDGISSWWVNLFGHCNRVIGDAIRAQLDTLEHVLLAGFTHPPVVELSERLSARTGGALGHAFYASDGASATEIALKMSHHVWRNRGQAGKNRFLCLAGSYHGETVGALAVTDVALFRDAYAALIGPQSAPPLPSPDARRAGPGESAADVAHRAAAALEAVLAREHASIAALIVEPLVQCATGFAMHDPAYLVRARDLCDHYGVHLICDEIAVGFGRTGTFFAHEQACRADGTPIRPDFLCLSKGITGGFLPLSVVLTTDAVYDVFYDADVRRGFLHSHSYTGNPLACRAALATLDLFDTHDTLTRNRDLASRLTTALTPIRQHPAVRHFRQTGLLWAFDVETTAGDFGECFFRSALRHELLLRPIGKTVYLMPPYVLTDADLAHLASATHAALLDALA